MAQKHNIDYEEKPMTRDGRIQGPSRRYRRLRHPSFSASEWAEKNPLLQRGEFGVEIDTHKVKCGTGYTLWNDLPYDVAGSVEWGNVSGDINNQTDLVDFVDDAVTAETDRAIQAESVLQDNIDAEALTRGNADTALQNQITTNKNTMDSHISNTNNPHSVTKTQVGLGNVDNTSDADKPISTATQAALDGKVDKNADITGATKCKITYDSKGLVTAGADLAESDIPSLHLSKITDVTATASEVNVLDGITATTAELNCTDGVTSNIQTQLDGKQATISDLATIRSNASAGKSASDTIATYGNIVTHNVSEFATSAQGALADSALQPGDNISELANDAGYLTQHQTLADLGITATASEINVLDGITASTTELNYVDGVTSAIQAQLDNKQSTLTAGSNITIAGTTISATDTTYTGSDGITLTGTNFTNSGVRAVSSGTANGTISVNTNGTSADVAVTGLGSAAYTASTDYATSAQGTKADTAVQPGDLATVATTGDYTDLLNKPTLAAVATSGAYSDLSGTPSLAAVATSGSYTDLSNKPTIPSVGDGTITIIQGGVSKGTFTTNQSGNTTIALDAGAGSPVWGSIGGTLSDQTDLQNALDAKQDVLTAGTGISIDSDNVISNSGVRSVSTGSANGTISVNTNGTSADVSVYGLGSAAYTPSTDYATAAQGGKADTAVQPADLATVATTGDYTDLLNKPTIPAAQVNSDWDAISGVTQILNKPTLGTMAAESASDYTKTSGLATVATSGSYNDLLNKPTIPTVNNATLTIQKNGTTVNTFTANASSNVTANITVPTKISDLTNDSNFANTDLSNLTSTGANIANWSSNVTNCITEIPQDIKLELSNGTLTLKAGSKVYVPNGVGVFDELIIQNDLTTITTWGQQVQLGLFVKSDGSTMFIINMEERCSSGSTPPASTTKQMWYDTTNNLVKQYASGSDTGDRYSLPVALVQKGDAVESSNISSIDQVFNGFGYIGSTIFALPGVKGLIPNGRNADGTLNNILTTVTTVRTSTAVSGNTGRKTITINNTGYVDRPGGLKYNERENRNYNFGSLVIQCICGYFTVGSDYKITDFVVKTAFHAVDYSDTAYIANCAMPGDRYNNLTIGATGTTYIAPADGYFAFFTDSITTSILVENSGLYGNVCTGAAGFTNWNFLPITKGRTVVLYYGALGITSRLYFIYAKGAQ